MMTEIPGGQVTIADLFRVMSEMRNDIGKALTSLEVINVRNQTADNMAHDHETRIRVLERFRYTLMGASVLVSTAITIAGYWIGHLH